MQKIRLLFTIYRNTELFGKAISHTKKKRFNEWKSEKEKKKHLIWREKQPTLIVLWPVTLIPDFLSLVSKYLRLFF